MFLIGMAMLEEADRGRENVMTFPLPPNLSITHKYHG
jgi:hypothetical protein